MTNEKIALLAPLFKQLEETQEKIKTLINTDEFAAGSIDEESLGRKKTRKVKGGGLKVKKGKRCSECGKKEVKVGGLCGACYGRKRYHEKHGVKGIKEEDDATGSAPQFNYECIDCGEKITSTLPIDEVKCPNNINHQMIQK